MLDANEAQPQLDELSPFPTIPPFRKNTAMELVAKQLRDMEVQTWIPVPPLPDYAALRPSCMSHHQLRRVLCSMTSKLARGGVTLWIQTRVDRDTRQFEVRAMHSPRGQVDVDYWSDSDAPLEERVVSSLFAEPVSKLPPEDVPGVRDPVRDWSHLGVNVWDDAG